MPVVTMATSGQTTSPSLPAVSQVCIPIQSGGHLTPSFIQDPARFPQMFPDIHAISEASRRTDRPFAADEFPNQEQFVDFAESGYVLEFRASQNHDVAAYGFILPSYYQRIKRPYYAELRICTFDPAPSVTLLNDLLSFLMDTSKAIGYRACIVDTFVCNLDMIEAARLQGFQNILVLRLSGQLPGLGLTDTLVFFKSLYPMDMPMPSPDDPSLQHLLEQRVRSFGKRELNLTFPCAASLPDGTKAIIKKMEGEHVPIFLEFFNRAVSRGQGFGPQDMPPQELLDAIGTEDEIGHGFVVYVKGHPAVWIYAVPSIYYRSYDPAITDMLMIVDESYVSKGIGGFFVPFCFRISEEMGYRGLMSDTFLSHVPVLRILRSLRFEILGTVWKGGYLKEKGYEDTVWFIKPLGKKDEHVFKLSKI